MMHRTLGARQIPQYHEWLIQHTRIFIHRLANDPEAYMAHIRAYSGGLALGVVYGYTVKTETGPKKDATQRDSERVDAGKDVYLEMAEDCLSIIANRITGQFGVWTVDVLPFLRYIPECLFPPSGWFLREARDFKKKYEQFAAGPWEWAKENSKVRAFRIASMICSHYWINV